MNKQKQIKPLGQRQLFSMKRASLETRINEYYAATQNSSRVIECLVAVMVRNALVFNDFSFICSALVQELFLTAEPNETTRRYMLFFKPYFKKSGDWAKVVSRFFKNKKEYHHYSEAIGAELKYLSTETAPREENAKYCYNLVSVFKAANGKKHNWTLRDIDPTRPEENIRALLKILTTLTILEKDGIRKFAQFVTFDCYETARIMHYEEPQEVLQEVSADNSTEEAKETLTIQLPHGFDPRTLSDTELWVLIQAHLPEGKTVNDVKVAFVEQPAETQRECDALPGTSDSSDFMQENDKRLIEKESNVPENTDSATAVSIKKPPKKGKNRPRSGSQLSAEYLINRWKEKHRK